MTRHAGEYVAAIQELMRDYRALALRYYLNRSHETRMTDEECTQAADRELARSDACQTAFALLVSQPDEGNDE